MPVVDDENRVLGVISEADILMLAGMNKGHTFKDILRNILGGPIPERRNEGKRGEQIMSFSRTDFCFFGDSGDGWIREGQFKEYSESSLLQYDYHCNVTRDSRGQKHVGNNSAHRS